jgi:hypothetical protein
MSLTLQPLFRSRYRRGTWTTILLGLFSKDSLKLNCASRRTTLDPETYTPE